MLLCAGGEANIYVHHDILLPALPLSLAWMNMRPAAADAQDKANMVAVGTMDPGIEIWDLDIADQVEPAATLGGYGPLTAAADEAAELAQQAENSSSKSAKKKAKAKAKKAAAKALAERPLKPGSHSDAVLGLSWNAEYRNVLASGSADSTVKVWDVSTCSCAHTLSHHSDKVQAVAWNPAESPVLLTGSFDKTTCLVSIEKGSYGSDSASWLSIVSTHLQCGFEQAYNHTSWLPCYLCQVKMSVPTAEWTNQHAADIVCAICMSVLQVDVRQPDGQALQWSISADVEALTWNPSQPTCFLVSSEDGLVVAFDARKGAGGSRMC